MSEGRKRLVVSLLCTVTVLFAFTLMMHSMQQAVKEPVVLIVPGGGLLADGTLPPHSELRMKKAAQLFRKYENAMQPAVIITLSAGTPHKPSPLSSSGFPLYESSVGAAYLIHNGVPSHKVFEEMMSLDTIGNVSYSTLIFYINSEIYFCEYSGLFS